MSIFQGLLLRALGLVSIALTFGACSAPIAEDEVSRVAPAVEAVRATSGSLPLIERLHGVVEARNQVEIRPEIAGRVVEVLVESGDAVEQGRPLVRLDDTIARQRLNQAEASLRLAEASGAEADARRAEIEAQAVRSRALAKQELISPLDLETQEARLSAAVAAAGQASARVDAERATVAERRFDLERTVVRAPTAGRVGQPRIEVGARVDTDTLLFVVGDLDRMTIEVALAESMLDHLEVGQTALVVARDKAEPLRATLTRISPFLEGGSFSTIGEIDVDNADGRLRPGMFVGVDVLYGETETATLVPTSALWDDPRDGVLGVHVVEASAALDTALARSTADSAAGPSVDDRLSDQAYAIAWRPVEVLAEGRASVGIRGVEADEWVVSLGHHLLDREDASARVRTVDWQHVLDLQGLQREDLLAGFLEEQRRVAATRGAELPSNAEFFGGASQRQAD